MMNAGEGGEEVTVKLKELRAQHQRSSGIFSAFIPSAIVLPVIMALFSIPFVGNKENENLKKTQNEED